MGKIVARNLYYKYFNSKFSLKNINFTINKGEFVLITGASGSGKSTLAYCLSGIIPHCIKNGEMRGKVEINGKSTIDVPLNELIKEVGIVLQNPESQIFGMTVEEDLAFGLENLGLQPSLIDSKIEQILKFLNLDRLRYRNPECLSGGQKQRLVIGSILTMEPEILILDEPFSNLDPLGIKMVISTLTKLKKMGKTLILIERKIDDLIFLVDRIIALRNGEVVADENPRNFFSNSELVQDLGVFPPQIVRLVYELEKNGLEFKHFPLTPKEFISWLDGAYNKS